MLRTFACAALALLIGAGVVLAKPRDKKKGHTYHGVIKKVDAPEGTLTVTVYKNKKDKAGTDMDFTIGAQAKVVVWTQDRKEEVIGKDGLKNEQFKQGTRVTVKTDQDNNVTSIQVGNAPKKPKKPKAK